MPKFKLNKSHQSDFGPFPDLENGWMATKSTFAYMRV